MLEDGIKIRDPGEQDLSPASESVHGVGENGPDADLACGLMNFFVDLDDRPCLQFSHRDQVRGMAVMIDEGIAFHGLLAVNGFQPVEGEPLVGTESHDHRDVFSGNPGRTQLIQKNCQNGPLGGHPCVVFNKDGHRIGREKAFPQGLGPDRIEQGTPGDPLHIFFPGMIIECCKGEDLPLRGRIEGMFLISVSDKKVFHSSAPIYRSSSARTWLSAARRSPGTHTTAG